MDRIVFGLEVEQFGGYALLELEIIKLDILRQYWDLSVRMRWVRLQDGIDYK